MKNILKATLLVIMITIAQPSQSNNLVGESPMASSAEKIGDVEAQKLISRLEEIKGMDKVNMTRSEKRALRKEVRASEKRLNSSGGIYLSVGAVIIIILLLILLV